MFGPNQGVSLFAGEGPRWVERRPQSDGEHSLTGPPGSGQSPPRPRAPSPRPRCPTPPGDGWGKRRVNPPLGGSQCVVTLRRARDVVRFGAMNPLFGGGEPLHRVLFPMRTPTTTATDPAQSPATAAGVNAGDAPSGAHAQAPRYGPPHKSRRVIEDAAEQITARRKTDSAEPRQRQTQRRRRHDDDDEQNEQHERNKGGAHHHGIGPRFGGGCRHRRRVLP